MKKSHIHGLRQTPIAITAAVALSMSALFAGVPSSFAEPYGDDDGGSSYDNSAVQDAPSGGMQQEPPGGGMHDEPPAGGIQDEPSGGIHDEPSGGGVHDEPSGGGMHDEPSSGGMQEEPAGGGMNTEPGGLATPTEAKASTEDVTTASKAIATDVVSTTVASQEITTYYQSIQSSFTSSTYSMSALLSSPISQWNSDWIGYDRYYRPVFTNPYPNAMQVIYDYGGTPQRFTIPPLQRAVLDVPNPGVYSFTSMTSPASGPPTNVAVGSFSGGGFQPAPGQAPPQKPADPTSIKNALVQVRFAQGVSDPFRVASLTDLGKDASVANATKVLLDGEVPAWGEWSTNDKGEAMFEITETQLMPGIRPPAQEPLPGYKVKLTATAQSGSWIDRNKTAVVISGAVAGALALAFAGVGLVVLRRRRDVE